VPKVDRISGANLKIQPKNKQFDLHHQSPIALAGTSMAIIENS